ncbi:VOC family protein [Brachybacterium sp. MASK1Z-5]|uniref:VOC family protein n=1 Tax=Brachybacterium halotolerans TaxID=2795215 RepID=A0ABS1BAD8_9MICO|nr:VOC family protein [Brachybacterium halotolerans]MBK0331625.1 VOC family protein [Brachybacterium halotolerans]
MTTSDATSLVSIRIITDDLDAMVDFYEQLTGTTAVRPAPVFAEILTPIATLALGSTATVPLFAPGSAEAGANRSTILEFLVDDVDAEYARLAALGMEFVAAPALMPWGNRVFFLRDPDQNLVGVFSPVTTEAIERFAGRYGR